MEIFGFGKKKKENSVESIPVQDTTKDPPIKEEEPIVTKIKPASEFKKPSQMLIELAEIDKRLCDLWEGEGFTKSNMQQKAKEYKEFIEKYS